MFEQKNDCFFVQNVHFSSYLSIGRSHFTSSYFPNLYISLQSSKLLNPILCGVGGGLPDIPLFFWGGGIRLVPDTYDS